MKKFLSSCIAGVLLLAAGLPASADEIVDYSGMAPFGESSVIVVSDTKQKSDLFRVHLYNVNPKGITVTPVQFDIWGTEKSPDETKASDLEAICPVPGSPDEYFMAESGYWKGTAGRVFRVHIVNNAMRGWVGTVKSIFKPFPMPKDGITEDALQIEGMSALKMGKGEYMMVFGLRGNGSKPAKIVMGTLKGEKFTPIAEKEFCLHKYVPNGRSCSDLQLVHNDDNSYTILAVGTADPGDLGPFFSSICQIGTLYLDSKNIVLHKPEEIYRVDGLKVEALSKSPATLKNSTFSVGTDDEVYPSIFRPLPDER